MTDSHGVQMYIMLSGDRKRSLFGLLPTTSSGNQRRNTSWVHPLDLSKVSNLQLLPFQLLHLPSLSSRWRFGWRFSCGTWGLLAVIMWIKELPETMHIRFPRKNFSLVMQIYFYTEVSLGHLVFLSLCIYKLL